MMTFATTISDKASNTTWGLAIGSARFGEVDLGRHYDGGEGKGKRVKGRMKEMKRDLLGVMNWGNVSEKVGECGGRKEIESRREKWMGKECKR